MKKTFLSLALSTAALGFAIPAAYADSDESVTAKQMVDAINAAEKQAPGRITEIDVERKKGKIVVEIETVDGSGKESKVWIDPETNQMVK